MSGGEKDTPTLNRASVLALNYDLLLQYPIHRLDGNARLQRPLSAVADAALIAEETLTNEAFDIIEALYEAERKGAGDDEQNVANDAKKGVGEEKTRLNDERLKRLLPLLLYRYRPLHTTTPKEDTPTEPKEPTPAAKDSMVIERERETLQILPFNFRPYNTGLCFNNWPLGRTKEIIVTAETVGEYDFSAQLFTGDRNVYYIAEPDDKLEWLNSKRSTTQEAFSVERFYRNADAFFSKYAPRARAIRKARFRSTLPESHLFRAFLFESRFAASAETPPTSIAAQWDSVWRDSLDALRYNSIVGVDTRRRRWHLLANLLALLQPTNIEQYVKYVSNLNSVLRFATDTWTNRQVELLEQLLRSTIYERGVAPAIAERKNNALLSIAASAAEECCSQITVAASTLLLYTALRSQFDARFFGGATLDERKKAANFFYRVVVSLQQSLDVSGAVHDVALSAAQLWSLAETLLRYLRENSAVSTESLDFVAEFVKHVVDNAATVLFFADSPFIDGSVRGALEQNFSKQSMKE